MSTFELLVCQAGPAEAARLVSRFDELGELSDVDLLAQLTLDSVQEDREGV